MANRSTMLNNAGSPEVNAFIFNKSSCEGKIRIKEFKTNNWEWAEFVLLNRNRGSSFRHDFDVVIGPVADSRVDPEIDKYKKEYGNSFRLKENLNVLAQRLKYPSTQYIQYCFCTEEALKHLIRD